MLHSDMVKSIPNCAFYLTGFCGWFLVLNVTIFNILETGKATPHMPFLLIRIMSDYFSTAI